MSIGFDPNKIHYLENIMQSEMKQFNLKFHSIGTIHSDMGDKSDFVATYIPLHDPSYHILLILNIGYYYEKKFCTR